MSRRKDAGDPIPDCARPTGARCHPHVSNADLYTKLFVHTSSTHDELLRQVATILNGRIEMWSVEAAGLVADARPNNEALAPDAQPYSYFVHYPFTVEVYSLQLELDEYLRRVGELMSSLDANGAAVVAACDWEELLPGGGALVGQ
jgi:hypothetical protein